MPASPVPPRILPDPFDAWFAGRGWTPHAHQLALLAAAEVGQSALLVAPTGGGKTLAGFLPSLIELAADPRPGLHTLYVSPLKALAVDVHRNLGAPIAEMGLPVTAETRTGDTPAAKRLRQRAQPPHLLLTTPESLALMLAYPDAEQVFATLRCVIIDEVHALADSKRGDLLALGLARLASVAPQVRRVGLSATIADPERLASWIGSGLDREVALVTGRSGARPRVEILVPKEELPWAGHMAVFSIPDVYVALKAARMAIVFVNTRAQAELVFQELWRLNEDTLPIALHHGSLAPEQRRKVEAAMAAGRLRAVVATSSLDLGIDWAAVDLVIQVGAPKGVSRLLQRIGRANHRLDEPSRALLVPANRFELLECQAAIDALDAGELDGPPAKPGGLDVLAQHVLGRACAGPFMPDDLYAEIVRAAPYADLSRKDFDDTLAFVANGGYVLAAYDRYRRLFRAADGRMHIVSERVARQYRMNVGTIIEAPMMKVMLSRRINLGEVEEYFVQGLKPGDSFVFAGRLVQFVRADAMTIHVVPGGTKEPSVPAYGGGRLPLTTQLADRVRGLLADPARWSDFPEDVRFWLGVQRQRSEIPGAQGLFVETFPRGGKHFLVAYCFEGRNAHQSLGMLLTRRMERFGYEPLGFVATDYVIAVWSLKEPTDVRRLMDEDMLGDDLEAWMAESSMLKRTFRNVAIIAGLIERKQPGQEKSTRQLSVNSDLIYDVLRTHEPDHILLRATWADAAQGLTDLARLAALLKRARRNLRHRRLDRISPLAVPVLLEIGRESVYGSAMDSLLDLAAQDLIAEALG